MEPVQPPIIENIELLQKEHRVETDQFGHLKWALRRIYLLQEVNRLKIFIKQAFIQTYSRNAWTLSNNRLCQTDRPPLPQIIIELSFKASLAGGKWWHINKFKNIIMIQTLQFLTFEWCNIFSLFIIFMHIYYRAIHFTMYFIHHENYLNTYWPIL